MVESSNCIGFAYYTLGLQPRDVYIEDAHPLEKYPELELAACQEDAQAIGFTFNKTIIGRGKDALLHLAVIDPNNHLLIIHRPSYGAEIESIPTAVLLEEYSRLRGTITPRFIRIRSEF